MKKKEFRSMLMDLTSTLVCLKQGITSCKRKLDSEPAIAYIVGNNTCHASHLNSAPGQVFAFYRVLSFNFRS